MWASAWMRGRRVRRLVASLIVAAAAVAAVATAALGRPQVVKVGNLIITVDGGVFPGRLPAHSYAPIGLRAEARLATADESHLPAARHLIVEFDKNGYLNTTGLPHCTVGRLKNTLTSEAKRICASSLIGFGRAGAEIEFPEQPPFFASGQMLIFNGPPKGGHPVLIFHVYAHVPAPTTFVTTAVVGKATGAYGTRVEVTVPTIVAGQGSLTFARLVVKKHWKAGGKTQNLLLARCPNGRFLTRGKMTFANGDSISGKVIRTCTPVS
jgi:hypothetical protein